MAKIMSDEFFTNRANFLPQKWKSHGKDFLNFYCNSVAVLIVWAGFFLVGLRHKWQNNTTAQDCSSQDNYLECIDCVDA